MREIILVHIPKNAGRAIQEALGLEWWQHDTASRVRARVGEKRWRAALKIACVRNPYDRAVSWFYYHKFSSIPFPQKETKRLMNQFETPSDWVLAGMPHIWEHRQAHIQASYLDEKIDLLCRSESLQADIDRVCDAAGRSRVQMVRTNAAPGRRSRDWRAELTPEAIQAVSEICKEDFTKFGYPLMASMPLPWQGMRCRLLLNKGKYE